MERRHAAGDVPVLAAHALAEAYSVLTRLPQPHRLRPEDALGVIEANWSQSRLVALTAAEYWQVLRRCREAAIAGGAVYDAVIAACGRKAHVATILTWDTSAFERFLEDEPAVRTPGAGSSR
jgi:predicted nucleic acid-binding protein